MITLAPFLANAAEEGRNVIVSMLVVGLVFVAVIILGDLNAAPRGSTRVEVTFNLDADGLLHVEATEVGTGRATSVTIEAASGLSVEEIKRLATRVK